MVSTPLLTSAIPLESNLISQDLNEPMRLDHKDFNQPTITLSLCQKISDTYSSAIQAFVKFLDNHEFFVTAMVLGTLLQEPWQAIKAAFMNLSNCKEHFNFYNLNPKILTKEQSQKRPILLIHGNYHNQSAWLGLAKKLQQVKELGPVYTINLPNGDITKKDFEIFVEKFAEIAEQYSKFNIDLDNVDVVGHSRGGALVQIMTHHMPLEGIWNTWTKTPLFLGKVIKIGALADQGEINDLRQRAPDFADNMYEVTGKYDILVSGQSFYDADHHKEVSTGHLGLLNSPEAHDYIIQCLVDK